MKTTILFLIFVTGVIATPLTRREYDELDGLLRTLIERDSGSHSHEECEDASFGVLHSCAYFLEELFKGDAKDMCAYSYYKDHCCATCAKSLKIQK